MALQQTVKLSLSILLLLTFASCVNNGDETKPKPSSGVKVALNKETIDGTWEIYFYSKLVVSDGFSISNLYRFTEFDGFTTTFQKNGAEKYDGVYYERNVFDMEIVRGEYELKTNNPTGTDSIRFHFESKQTGKDTVSISSVPNVFENRFVHHDRYNGVAQGKQFYIEDIKYLRNLERDPNYYPTDNPAFKKNIIDINKLLGTWELFNRSKKINGASVAIETGDYGARLMFSIEGGKQVFREFVKGETIANGVGEFKITDDVVNMYISYYENEGDPKPVIVAYKIWIREWSTAGSTELIIDGDKFRDKDDVLKEVEDIAYYKKVN